MVFPADRKSRESVKPDDKHAPSTSPVNSSIKAQVSSSSAVPAQPKSSEVFQSRDSKAAGLPVEKLRADKTTTVPSALGEHLKKGLGLNANAAKLTSEEATRLRAVLKEWPIADLQGKFEKSRQTETIAPGKTLDLAKIREAYSQNASSIIKRHEDFQVCVRNFRSKPTREAASYAIAVLKKYGDVLVGPASRDLVRALESNKDPLPENAFNNAEELVAKGVQTATRALRDQLVSDLIATLCPEPKLSPRMAHLKNSKMSAPDIWQGFDSKAAQGVPKAPEHWQQPQLAAIAAATRIEMDFDSMTVGERNVVRDSLKKLKISDIAEPGSILRIRAMVPERTLNLTPFVAEFRRRLDQLSVGIAAFRLNEYTEWRKTFTSLNSSIENFKNNPTGAGAKAILKVYSALPGSVTENYDTALKAKNYVPDAGFFDPVVRTLSAWDAMKKTKCEDFLADLFNSYRAEIDKALFVG